MIRPRAPRIDQIAAGELAAELLHAGTTPPFNLSIAAPVLRWRVRRDRLILGEIEAC